MKLYPIQNAFTAGAMSPLLHGRYDTDGYQQGVETLVNMWPDPRGPLRSRAGMIYSDTFDGSYAKVGNLQVNDRSAFIFILQDVKLSVAKLLGGKLPELELLSNPSFNDLCDDWTLDADGPLWSVNCLQGRVDLVAGNAGTNRTALVRQQLTGLTIGSEYRIRVSTLSASGAQYVVRVGTSEGGSEILEAVTGQRVYEAVVTSTGDSIWVEVANETADTTVLLDAVSVSDETDTGFEVVAPWAGVDVQDVHFVPAPSGQTVYFFHRSYPAHKLDYDSATGTFEFVIVPWVGVPPEWGEGNYPATGAIFQGRLWVGGTNNEPETLWGSRSGEYEDFTAGSEADDGVQFTLEKFGAIRWMTGLKSLMVGTANGEYIVSSDTGLIAPGDIQVLVQSSYGSNRVQPVQVGDQIFYISPDGTKVRAMQYDWQADNYLSTDLSFTAEHLTTSGITSTAWVQNPDNQFVCVLANGDMVSMTYERGQGTYGWSQTLTDGMIISSTKTSYDGNDTTVLAVQRTPGEITLEYILPDSLLSDRVIYMDSQKAIDSITPETSFGPFDHLIGKTVQVLADGATHPDVVVDEFGFIELQSPAQAVRVGLAMGRKVVTLAVDLGAPGGGSGSSWVKRRSQIYMRMLNSARPVINGTRPPTRYPSTPMNTPEPVRSEDVFVTTLGYDETAKITVEQNLPLDLNIIGLFGELDQSSL